MSKQTKYYISIRPNDVVGPHRLDTLREWVYLGFLSPATPACKEGDETWTTIEQLPKFSEFPTKLQERLIIRKKQPSEHWWSDAPSDKQLAKLAFFNIPFDSRGLTKGRASQLIDYFVSIDPARETEYKNQPATKEQRQRIRELGGSAADLTYDAAKDMIQDLEIEANDKEWDELENPSDLDLLEEIANDEDARDLYDYKKLTKAEVQQFLTFLQQKWPDWRDASHWDVAQRIPDVFPHRKKVSRRPAATRSTSKAAKGSGCLIIALALLAASSLVLCMAHFILHVIIL